MSDPKANPLTPIEQSFALISALSLIQQSSQVVNQATKLTQDGTLDEQDVTTLSREFDKIASIAKQQQTTFKALADYRAKLLPEVRGTHVGMPTQPFMGCTPQPSPKAVDSPELKEDAQYCDMGYCVKLFYVGQLAGKRESRYFYGKLEFIPGGQEGKEFLHKSIESIKKVPLWQPYHRILKDSEGKLYLLTAPLEPYTVFFREYEKKVYEVLRQQGALGMDISALPLSIDGKVFELISIMEDGESLLKYLDNYTVKDDGKWI